MMATISGGVGVISECRSAGGAENAGVLCGDEAREKIAGCLRILRGEDDKASRGAVCWNEQATQKDRRLLLAMAGVAESERRRLMGMSWRDLPVQTRSLIMQAIKRWQQWAARLN